MSCLFRCACAFRCSSSGSGHLSSRRFRGTSFCSRPGDVVTQSERPWKRETQTSGSFQELWRQRPSWKFRHYFIVSIAMIISQGGHFRRGTSTSETQPVGDRIIGSITSLNVPGNTSSGVGYTPKGVTMNTNSQNKC